MKKEKCLISLGIGPNQISLIQLAIQRGFEVIGIDQNINQAHNVVGLERIKCSIYDSEKIIEILEKRFKNYPPKGLLLRTTGPGLLTAAKISEKYNLNRISESLAKASVKKSDLRIQCKELNLPFINGKTLENIDTKRDFLIGKIIKPDIPLVGKKNVYLPTNLPDAISAFEKAKKESYNNLVEIQEYEDGIDLTLMIFCEEKKIVKSLVIEEWVGKKVDKFFGIGVSINKENKTKKIKIKMISVVKKILKFWNFNSGIVFFTFRLGKNKIPYLYEVNLGLSGDNVIDYLLPAAFMKQKSFFYDLDISLGIGSPVNFELNNPIPLAIVNGKIMKREIALEFIFTKFEFYDLKRRILNYGFD